jgi:MFS family permease
MKEIEELETEELQAVVSNTAIAPERSFHLKKTFTALKHRNYKLWFWGQMTSMLGTWMQMTAQGFLIYDLTHSPVYLGYVGFAYGMPSWLFMMYGGVIADRLPKDKILLVTQTVMMILAVILAALTFIGHIEPWHILLLTFLLGSANAFDAPARVSLVNELVPKADLTNAIALNSTIFNVGTALGPAVAGITYALFGPAWCFIINALSFIGIIAAIRMMKLKQTKIVKSDKSVLEDIKEGLRYVRRNPTVRTLIIMVASISIFGLSFATIIPAWAVKILDGDSATNGFLQSARGVGALMSALAIASLGRFNYKGKLLTIGSIAFPVFTIIFSFVKWIPLSLFMLMIAGSALILAMNIANSLVQTLVPDNLRGRVMGLYTFTFFGFLPVGALIMGVLAEHLGEQEAVLISTSITLLVSMLIYFFAPSIRKLE